MSHIFVSYSSQNRDAVQKIVNQLLRWQFNVWIDTEGLQAGERWLPQLISAIHASKILLLIVSSESATSDWVQREYEEALAKKIPVIPYIISPRDQNDLARFPAASQIHSIFADTNDALEKLRQQLPVETRVHGKNLYNLGLLRPEERNQLTFGEAAQNVTNDFENGIYAEINGEILALAALPLYPGRYVRTYLVGKKDSSLKKRSTVQLAIQASGPYMDTDFTAKITRHCLENISPIEPNILLVAGPIRVTFTQDKTTANYTLNPKEPDEWEDVVISTKVALEKYHAGGEKPDLQIFIQGPAIMLYKLGTLLRLYNAQLFHYDSSSKTYSPVLNVTQ